MKTIKDLERKSRQEGDCRIWFGGVHKQGYPLVRYNKQMKLVSRIVLEDKLNRTLTRSERVKNTCGNILCINPNHYIVAKPGEKEYHRGGKLKLSYEEQEELIALYDSKENKWGVKTELAEKYGVGIHTVSRILKRGPRTRPSREV